ncbi:hypothetical protein [Actinomadura logoneensis]|uniref:hypothetical protein n=1 Tax=Actinomadura logoneensis TaxID=2293572 RepID=UPI0013146CF7|nr:hypothetical protein [Actinomadura logoneensis]
MSTPPFSPAGSLIAGRCRKIRPTVAAAAQETADAGPEIESGTGGVSGFVKGRGG